MKIDRSRPTNKTKSKPLIIGNTPTSPLHHLIFKCLHLTPERVADEFRSVGRARFMNVLNLRIIQNQIEESLSQIIVSTEGQMIYEAPVYHFLTGTFHLHVYM